MATSISAITARSSAVASCAPSRWPRSVSASVLISNITCSSGSSPPPVRARIEKSPSRSAASRFETVCSGRATWRRAARAAAQPDGHDGEPRPRRATVAGQGAARRQHAGEHDGRERRRPAPAPARGDRGSWLATLRRECRRLRLASAASSGPAFGGARRHEDSAGRMIHGHGREIFMTSSVSGGVRAGDRARTGSGRAPWRHGSRCRSGSSPCG